MTATAGVERTDIASTVSALRATFDSGRTRDRAWRARQLRAIGTMLAERADDFVQALAADLGRDPLDSVMLDLSSTKGELRHAQRHLAEWMRPRRVSTPLPLRPGRSSYQYQPLGVVLIIGPWNYPIHLTLTPLISAIAAGNCVVIKPSEITPASSAVLARLLPQYLDADAVAVVEGGPEATGELIAQVPDHCFFTGSPSVGRIVAAECGARLVPVTLELGGKCPAIVTRSANLRVAARRIAFGKITNSGQTCVAPDYVLVDREVRDAFVTELVETLARFSEGKPVPIVNARHAARLDGLLRTAAGRVALGGTIDTVNASADLTVIVDPDPDAPIVHEEIFGPLLPVLTVDSLDDALSHVRRGTRPLASYLFTEDGDEPDRAVAAISTGGFVVNHTMVHLGVPELPFGGVGTSGTGRYHGKWGFETFANPLAVLRKPSRPDPALFYPPRNPLVQRLLRALL